MSTQSENHGRKTAESPSEAFADLWKRTGRLERQITRLASLKLDHYRLKTRRVAVGAFAAAAALIVMPCSVLIGVWLTARGLAGGVADVFPGQPWLGDAAAGLLLIGGICGMGVWAWRRNAREGLKKLRVKYERTTDNGNLTPEGAPHRASQAVTSARDGRAGLP